METWDADARPGDVVLGHDGHHWGVLAIVRAPRFAVTLVRHGEQITGYPPPGTPVTIVARGAAPSGPAVEMAAMATLINAGLMPQLMAETWRQQ